MEGKIIDKIGHWRNGRVKGTVFLFVFRDEVPIVINRRQTMYVLSFP